MLLGRDVVEEAARVAAVGIGFEVGIGEAEVTFVGVDIGVAVFEFDLLIEGRVRFPREFDHRLDHRIARLIGPGNAAARLDRAEAVGAFVIELGEVAELARVEFEGITVVALGLPGVVAPVGRAQVELLALGDGGRKEVDDPTGGVGAVTDLARAFQHFDPGHSRDVGGVISRRCGVRGRSLEDAVFHHRDLLVAGAVDAPDRDVGEKTRSIFLTHIDPRDAGEDSVRVRVIEFADLLGRHEVAGAGKGVGLPRTASDDLGFDRVVDLDFDRARGGRCTRHRSGGRRRC